MSSNTSDGDPAASATFTAPAPATFRPPFDAAEVLSRLWQQNLPVMRERVACLERAAAAATAGHLTAELRTQASDLAHKLAGSLGMFGFPEGTRVAREIEHLLEAQTALDAGQFLRLAHELRAGLPL